MSHLAPTECSMWERPINVPAPSLNENQINEKYTAGELRIVTETNREKIPNFVTALSKPDYMQVRPFYQRRKRWDTKRQSLLIESFIMNIPVPPLFLYEKDYNSYEVMDGQQRITALQSFYNGEYSLSGLEIWKELNGKTYSELPSQVRRGLDRRSISYIVVLRESSPDEEDAMFLRQTVFARLNTGGVKLEHQEIRNCLFQGKFNDMIVDLTQEDSYRKAFGLPLFTSEEEEDPNAEIKKNISYIKMIDAESVLRFFALRHYNQYTRGMHGFLDIYMTRAGGFNEEDISFLRDLFMETLQLASAIYGELIFKPYDIGKNQWSERTLKGYYDAVMVNLASCLDKAEELVAIKEEIIELSKKLFVDNPPGTFTGKGNSKTDIENRIVLYEAMLTEALGG